ncbi:MAG: succinylglutamate desuccinylase/aspartoacylase family protein [Alicycliphilus sp.]|jgi:succinylglutamate desuccinylase|uniref:Succinylglutamate desuccinylase/aspartoacylase family protein n=1 Tax=Diaphorobacter limosus TaxID=3036128 RepID=A0ABZ0J0A8_9BURK|nr:succinylglutamate desuccinylase/aspartoacylase family protein [Diaphorobacter sp. Y-1]MBP6779514.1 succinylglutamate desuccinylase/aspartoacylase family protein [Ottowia sp.]MBP7330126.1 succinylglutamate desuccinylase/aspartoacylase family protein [Alicycliphilus sp.]MBP8138218.1 succinylglutamate desuccinylase/aspartoacylase family protein [Alicycliphilus sp.]MBP8780750.1 succinylglutamate desuccinylase/aspartoacylase family protein [Alicycliphilus sp.]TXJ17139.1 MAG: succinylglutamate de
MNSSLRFDLPAPDLSAWRAGNTGTEGVWHFDSGLPGRQVLVSALIHGNELCGAWALKGLLESGLRPQAGSLTLMFCNLAAFDRFDPANHDAARFVEQDMNRQWSDERMDAADSLERRRCAALRPFVARADWLLDLHSMHEPCAPLLLTGVQPRNLALAKQMAAPEHIVIDAGHQDGTRMRDYGRFGLPDAQAGDSRSLLVECGFHGDPASRAVAQDQCLRFIEASGIVDGAELARLLPGWRLTDAPRQWALQVTGPVVAKNERFTFTEAFTGLEVIARAGTVIGDNDGEPVTTPYDDCVLVMPSTRQARAGVSVVRFARRRPL